MKKKIIPRREQELVEREAKRARFLDTEKVATTSIKRLIVDRVVVTSRYNKAHEFEVMQDILLACSPRIRRVIAEFFCDSKATYCYSVKLRISDRDFAQAVVDVLQEAALSIGPHGHNGIDVSGSDGEKLSYLDPYWQFDEDEMNKREHK